MKDRNQEATTATAPSNAGDIESGGKLQSWGVVQWYSTGNEQLTNQLP